MKRFCRVHRVLPRHRIHYEQYFMWLNRRFDAFDFAHHFFIDMKPARCVDDNSITRILPRMVNAVLRNVDRRVRAARKNRNLNLRAEHDQLVDSRRTVDISSNKKRTAAF